MTTHEQSTVKILMVLEGTDFPPDIRVEKEARALQSAGHQILLVCENLSNRPRHEIWQGIEIIRLAPLAPWRYRLQRMWMFLTLHDRRWEQKLSEVIRSERPDAIHIHDLLYVGPGVRVAKRFQLPIVADLHENYPALVEIRDLTMTSSYRAISRFIYSADRLRHYERTMLPQCDKVIVVVDEAATRIAAATGLPLDQIAVVGNSEDIDEAERMAPQTIVLPPAALRLLYVGGFGIHRGLEVVIQAMPQIRQRLPSAQFVIVGDGQDLAQLTALAQQLGVQDAVCFEGRQPFSRVHGYIEASDICLVPHVANEHTDSTIPHKLFQYMYMQKPVVVSSAKPLARIVKAYDAGAVFQSGDPVAFAEAIFSLTDPERRRVCGQHGQQAVIERYHWAYDAAVLTQLYQELADQAAK